MMMMMMMCWYRPVLRLDQRVSDVGNGQVGLQVLVLLTGLAVAPQNICKSTKGQRSMTPTWLTSSLKYYTVENIQPFFFNTPPPFADFKCSETLPLNPPAVEVRSQWKVLVTSVRSDLSVAEKNRHVEKVLSPDSESSSLPMIRSTMSYICLVSSSSRLHRYLM